MKSNSTAGCQAHKQGDCVRLFSKKGNDLSHRFPSLARSLRGFAVDTAILDGEVVAVDQNGRPDFTALFTAELEPVQFWAFDLLEVDGRVLAMSPLLERRRGLTHVFETPPEGYLLSETFEDAKALLRAADRFGLEGIVQSGKRWVTGQARVPTGSRSRPAHGVRPMKNAGSCSNPPGARRFWIRLSSRKRGSCLDHQIGNPKTSKDLQA